MRVAQRHKKKYAFLGVVGAVGYMGYRAYCALNDEMRRLEERFRKMASDDPSWIGADAPGELQALKREQLFVQAQLACDAALAALLPALEARVHALVPSPSSKDLKEALARISSKEGKVELMEVKMMSLLLHTGLALYALAGLAVALKATYAAAACAFLHEGADAAGAAVAAERLLARVASQVLESNDGLLMALQRLRSVLEDCLAGWHLTRPCGADDLSQLWLNVRHVVDDVDAPLPGALPLALQMCLPPTDTDDVLAQSVAAALRGPSARAVAGQVLAALFDTHAAAVKGQWDSDTKLPLLRAVSQTQSQVASILQPGSPYLHTALTLPALVTLVQGMAGIDKSAPKRVALVSPADSTVVSMALAIARAQSAATTEAFGVVLDAAAAAGPVDGAALAALGVPASARPGTLASVDGLHFDLVVVLGSASAERVPLLYRKLASWPDVEAAAAQDAARCHELLKEKLIPLLLQVAAQ